MHFSLFVGNDSQWIRKKLCNWTIVTHKMGSFWHAWNAVLPNKIQDLDLSLCQLHTGANPLILIKLCLMPNLCQCNWGGLGLNDNYT